MVYVTAVEHPQHFWLQVLSTKSTQLDTLLEQMTEFYGKKNLVMKLFLFFSFFFVAFSKLFIAILLRLHAQVYCLCKVLTESYHFYC